MAQEKTHGSKGQAIRDFLAENPGVPTLHVVEALAARDIRVSAAFVATVQAMMESKAKDAPEAKSTTVSTSLSGDQPDTERAFPAVSSWVKDYGWIEIGMQEHQGFVTKAMDEGGLVCEASECETLAEAMSALDEGIRNWLSRQ